MRHQNYGSVRDSGSSMTVALSVLSVMIILCEKATACASACMVHGMRDASKPACIPQKEMDANLQPQDPPPAPMPAFSEVATSWSTHKPTDDLEPKWQSGYPRIIECAYWSGHAVAAVEVRDLVHTCMILSTISGHPC